MSVGQTDFTRAILAPDLPAPTGLSNPDGVQATRRFDVYRNNVAASLTEALVAAFPVVHKLVGDDFFRTMAGIFLRQHPPRNPLLMFYGEDMPAFLAQFEPAQQLPYLPDVARLECELRRSYHAADAAPLDLDAIGVEALLTMPISLSPATRVCRSDWPMLAIWLVNTQPDAPKPVMQAEDVLITRPEFDPAPQLLPAGGADFVTAIAEGANLTEAAEKAAETTPDFDLTTTLGLLLAGRALTAKDPL